MDQQAKQKWLAETLTSIRNKKLQNPVRLNAATYIPDLERELQLIEKAMLHYSNKKNTSPFCLQIKYLKKFMKTYYTIKLKTCGTVHICYKKEINGEMYYVAPNHFHKWKCTNKKIELLN